MARKTSPPPPASVARDPKRPCRGGHPVSGPSPLEEVRRADKIGDKAAGGVLVNVDGLSHLAKLAFLHDYHPVGDGKGLFLVVGHVDHGLLQLLLEPFHLGPEPDPDLGVEGGERLVEQKHPGIRREGPDQRHPLLLATRELGRVEGPPVPEPDEVEHLVDPVGDLPGRPLSHLEAEGDVLLHRHVGEEGIGLEDDPELPFLGDEVVDDPAVVDDLPACGRLESRDHPEDRRLPAAAGAEKTDELTLLDLESDMVDGGQPAVLLE